MNDLRCDDCGRNNRERGMEVPGFGSTITHDGQSRVYCERCKRRRGAMYLFDSRPWSVIEAEHKRDVA